MSLFNTLTNVIFGLSCFLNLVQLTLSYKISLIWIWLNHLKRLYTILSLIRASPIYKRIPYSKSYIFVYSCLSILTLYIKLILKILIYVIFFYWCSILKKLVSLYSHICPSLFVFHQCVNHLIKDGKLISSFPIPKFLAQPKSFNGIGMGLGHPWFGLALSYIPLLLNSNFVSLHISSC